MHYKMISPLKNSGSICIIPECWILCTDCVCVCVCVCVCTHVHVCVFHTVCRVNSDNFTELHQLVDLCNTDVLFSASYKLHF